MQTAHVSEMPRIPNPVRQITAVEAADGLWTVGMQVGPTQQLFNADSLDEVFVEVRRRLTVAGRRVPLSDDQELF